MLLCNYEIFDFVLTAVAVVLVVVTGRDDEYETKKY